MWKRENIQQRSGSLEEIALMMWESEGNDGDGGLRRQNGNNNCTSTYTSKTTLDAPSVSQEQQSEDTVNTVWKKHRLVSKVPVSAVTP